MTKVKNSNFGTDKEAMVFKITMEIHSCHEKLKRGLRSEDGSSRSGAHLLLDYYRKLSGSSVPILNKNDTIFVDTWDIVRVYSVQLDETFPLIEYPYRLFRFYLKNLDHISENDKSIIDKIEKIGKNGKPSKTKDFMKIYTIMQQLSPGNQKKLMIQSFFAD